ncbi:MAG: NUDIX hydrolase [Candidatus Omnitrophica bacterium]|nr:NUDIX hydrolase [Candidatus Omnitrophota bacterium]
MKNVFKGKRLNIFTGDKTMPDGSRAYHEEVRHPGASLIVPFLKNKVVMIHQYRAVIDKYIWELPAGVLEPDETPANCAKREVTEETGYIVKAVKKLGFIYTTPGFTNEVIHIFSAVCALKTHHRREPDEFIKIKLMSKKQVKGLFLKGKIHDSKTLAALKLAEII